MNQKPKAVLLSGGAELPIPDSIFDEVAIEDDDRQFWLTFRQTLIMQLGAIEDRLEMPRSIVPRRKREHGCRCEERKAS